MMKSGDLVLIRQHACCNPTWGSASGTIFIEKNSTLGVLLEERLEWYRVFVNNIGSGWIWFREVSKL